MLDKKVDGRWRIKNEKRCRTARKKR